MGIFSGLKRGGDEQEWMAELLSEVDAGQSNSTPEAGAATESWNFPDDLEFELAKTAPPVGFTPQVPTEAHVLESILPSASQAVPTERRSPEPVALAASTPGALAGTNPPLGLAPASNGPSGTRAGELLPSFGLGIGASWSELQSAYLELKSSCDPVMATSPGDVERFREVLTDANVAYAALRLTAVGG